MTHMLRTMAQQEGHYVYLQIEAKDQNDADKAEVPGGSNLKVELRISSNRSVLPSRAQSPLFSVCLGSPWHNDWRSRSPTMAVRSCR